MDDLNVWGVNWIDGMLITSRHFHQEADFTLNLSRAANLALASGYGLAKPASLQTEPLELQLRKSGPVTTITVQKCACMLPNGSIVNINPAFLKYRSLELAVDLSKEKRERIPIFLYASPTERSAFGEPQSGELLSRLPYAMPKVILSVGPSEAHSATAGMQIAEVIKSGDEAKLNESFVPSFVTTTCGKAVKSRIDNLRKLFDGIQRAGVAAIAEVRMKVKSRPSASEEEIIRGVFLQSENLLHNIGLNANALFDTHAGIGARALINYLTGLIGSFQQSFLIYPDLRESVRNAQINTDQGAVPGTNVLTELRDYQQRSYGYEEMTQFFDDSERILGLVVGVLNLYAKGGQGTVGDSLKSGEYVFMRQQHGAVKYSFRANRHYIIIDGVDPRGTEDVIVRVHKKILPQQFAINVIIYLGANEIDDIAAASVARKPIEDVTDPDFWLIQPNEYFPLKSSRLDRLNIIIDGDVDRSALEAVQMNHVAIFSRAR